MADLAELARMTPFQRRVCLPLGRGISWLVLTLLGPIRVRGQYRIPQNSGLLILANHLADIDPILVQAACRRPIHFMGKSELFDMPVIGRVVKAFGGFPVKRGEPDRAALKLAAQLIKDGEVVAVFPEGELSEHCELLPLKSGIALITRLAPGIPVICCGIQNSHLVMPYGKLLPRPAFKTIEVTWGEPRTFSKSSTTEEILGWATQQLLELTNATP